MKFGLNKGKTSFTLKKTKQINLLGAEADQEEPINTQKQKFQTSQVEQLHKDALEQDSEIFDYDSAYDNLKKQQILKKRQIDGEPNMKRAKYMENLINASKQRKKDFELRKETKIQKQREQEIELYGETEQFITSSYLLKQQQDQCEEQKQKLELEQNNSGDVNLFYRNLLNQQSEKQPIILGKDSNIVLEKKQKIITTNAVVNDSGEVVDNIQLLKTGLNILNPKPKQTKYKAEDKNIKYNAFEARKNFQRKNIDLLKQKKLVELKKEKEKSERNDIMVENLIVPVNDDIIKDARARFLARKKAASANK
jgi:hypothetical protein